MDITTGPLVGQPVLVEEIDYSLNPVVPEWVPRWIVDCGHECDVGIAVDDHCFVVLARDWHGRWGLTRHIPWQVARKLGELSETVTP